MKVRKNSAGTVVLTFFGVVFVLLFIGTVAILDEAEKSQRVDAGLHLGNIPQNGTRRDSDNTTQAPPMHLPIGNEKEVPFPRDFLFESLRKNTQFLPDRFEPQLRGI